MSIALPSFLGFQRPVDGGGGAFEPDDIAGLLFWWKADSLSLSNNDPVSSWSDSSGNGRTLSQANSSQRPLYKTNILNGHPGVLFDGSNDKLATSSLVVGLKHVFVVCKYNATTFASFDGLITKHASIFSEANIILTAEAGTTKFYNSTQDENYKKNGTAFADNDMQGPMNAFAVVENQVDAWAASGEQIALACDRDFEDGRFWNGYIVEVCGYDSALSSGDSADVRQYFYDKYALSGV